METLETENWVDEATFLNTVHFYKKEILTLVKKSAGETRGILSFKEISVLKTHGVLFSTGKGQNFRYFLTPKTLEALGRKHQLHRREITERDSRGRFVSSCARNGETVK